jgi:DNA-binding CsgD family transcriptional regulator
MYGRERERRVIRQLLADACTGRSGALVLCGEPGVGKSAVLAFAAEAAQAADRVRVLRGAGVETEVELAYAGLHQLLRPVLGLLERLPGPQADALGGALGLHARASADRFLTAVAVLTLLSEAAEDGPVLCLLDDAHWLDRASTEALAFVARRLEAEGVVLLAASREAAALPGLPQLEIGGLDPAAATALLRTHAPGLPPKAARRLIEETGGNPLALLELAGALSAEQLGNAGPLPLTERVKRAFTGHIHRLPAPTRRLLLVAAADDTGELGVLFGAAQALGVPAVALEPAEQAGLVRVDPDGGGRVSFRHPLVRAAVYQGATLAERLAVHGALAGAVDGDLGRRAWHLAASVAGQDEAVAAELERSAEQARRRGGHAVAAAAFERAAELSTTPPTRGRRLTAAAEEAYDAGQVERAGTLARQAEAVVGDPYLQAGITALRGMIELLGGSFPSAHRMLVGAARQLVADDPERAVAMLTEAVAAAEGGGDPRAMAEAVAALGALPLPDGHPLRLLVSAYLGYGAFFAGEPAAGLPRIREAVAALAGQAQRPAIEQLKAGELALVLGDHTAALAFATQAVASCRARGLVGRLPLALASLARIEVSVGRHDLARAHAAEGLRLAQDLGQAAPACLLGGLLALAAAVHGDEPACRRLLADAVRLGKQCNLAIVVDLAPWHLGLLELTRGRPKHALDPLLEAARKTGAAYPLLDLILVPDLVEAAVRAGRPACAAKPLARFQRWAVHTGQPWAAAVLERCRALLADADAAAAHFQAAVDLHEQAGSNDRPFERARTELAYGERLRRARRRAKARLHLLAAHERFARLDATVWAERAAAELRATGETVRRRDPSAVIRLTPQELQVVRLAAEGGSYKDIAAQLFISPRTVGYHLSHAFTKLGIASRRELARVDLDTLITEA